MADRSSDAAAASTSGSVEHTVTKLDSLAGIAIKYGVEVSDIKRLNGLTTDLQMFALKTLRIPPARHSFGRSRFEARSGMHRASSHDSNLNDERPRRSSAMDMLRGYYGLPSSGSEEGTELVTFISHEPALLPLDESRRLSTGDLRTRSDAGWLINSIEPSSMKSSRDPLGVGDTFGEIKVVTEADRPIRRRPRGDDEMLDLPDRSKDSASSETPPRTIGAALFGGRVAVESLISRVQAGKALLPSGGALEVYRRAKAALD